MTRNPNAVIRVLQRAVRGRWPVRRLVVEGDSMRPTLEPGDRVLAVRGAVRVGDLVAVRDPREARRTLVKRAARLDADGRIEVVGDNPDASTDSRHFGPVRRDAVLGRVVYRYAPAGRAGPFTRGARSPRPG